MNDVKSAKRILDILRFFSEEKQPTSEVKLVKKTKKSKAAAAAEPAA